MMNPSSQKRSRGGRMPPNQRDKRPMYSSQDRQGKFARTRQQRPQQIERSVTVDGIFQNSRFTHVIISLVGSVVQVQVKNGTVYEGILKTVSTKGDTVLEFAHIVEENNSSNSMTPSRERIVDQVIILSQDVLLISAANVDMDYAVRDTFTDTGISKYNGETKDKEMRELQPWDSEGGLEVGLLDDAGKSSNGWDVNDMFQTNATQFNVKSSYDETLAQYTTKLEKSDSEDYRRKEEKAKRLAAEIEGSETYKKHIALENGEGDDEEALFSSVVRPSEGNPQSGSTGGGSGKYIPPNKRGQGMSKQPRESYSRQQQQQNIGRSMSNNHQQSPTSSHLHSSSSASEVTSVNGDSPLRASIPASTAGPTVTTSPTHDQASTVNAGDVKNDHNPSFSKADKKVSLKGAKGRDKEINELKEFSSKFKLDDNKDTKDKEKDKSSSGENKDNSNSEDKESVLSEKGSEATVHDKSSEDEKASEKGSQEKMQDSVSDSPGFSFKLNPLAEDFVPKKQQQPQQQQQQQPFMQQMATSPHPQTQSPVIQQPSVMNMPPHGHPQHPQPVYPGPGQQYIMPPTQMMQNLPAHQQQIYNHKPKRVVVSAKTDYTAQVQAATGQPLLAHQTNPNYIQYMQMVHHAQPTGYQMGQMMTMPPAQQTGQRFSVPPTSSMPVMPPTSLPSAGGGLDQANPSIQASQVYSMMTPPQPGPMPAHMGPHIPHISHMSHMGMTSGPQTSQHSQVPPSAAGHHAHHHPAPSPVHTNSNQQPINPGQHPPSSGTPQPPPGYPTTLQAHPPLQASPHNQTSPQTMQQMPYGAYNTAHAHQLQQMSQQQPSQQQSAGAVSGGQPMSMPQQSSVPTTVTYSLQAHNNMQPQYVMMPPHGGQVHQQHLQSQFHSHQMPGHGAMQPQMMSQSGIQGMPTQNLSQGPHPATPMQQYIPPVQHHGGQPVQNYPPPQ